MQADSWTLGLRVVISWCHQPRPFNSWSRRRGVQSCVNSPAGVIQRKNNLGLLEDANQISQVFENYFSVGFLNIHFLIYCYNLVVIEVYLYRVV